MHRESGYRQWRDASLKKEMSDAEAMEDNRKKAKVSSRKIDVSACTEAIRKAGSRSQSTSDMRFKVLQPL